MADKLTTSTDDEAEVTHPQQTEAAGIAAGHTSGIGSATLAGPVPSNYEKDEDETRN